MREVLEAQSKIIEDLRKQLKKVIEERDHLKYSLAMELWNINMPSRKTRLSWPGGFETEEKK